MAAAALEDGEVLDSESDSEMTTGAEPQNQQSALPNYSATPFPVQNDFQPRPTSFDLSSCYRVAASDNSSEDSEQDSEEEERLLWRKKRQKCSHSGNGVPPKPAMMPFGTVGESFAASGNSAKPAGRKINNIWGRVLQEQNQDAVATELGILGMEGNIDMNSRQSETYNYIQAKKIMEKQRQEEEEKEMAKLEKELDEYVQDGKSSKSQQVSNPGNLKRKRPVKERLGERLEMDYKGKCDITEDDSPDKISDEIAYRLREPKAALIHRVVKAVGKKKAIELLMQTAEVEQNGGLMIVDGSRRRTPGGVYLQLLKNMPSITQDQLKEIFYDENQREYNSKKAAKKRRRHIIGKKMKQAIKELNLQVDDDASRETFASDTNDALASVEDTEEVQMEKSTLDPEDAIELDNSNDLEIF
ncbi:phosphorylated adapter RNA export protein [Pristis pectinata]|uniref:phosphorylated adapter RNA export protein n=1 Tax=Pristis pectinata TaxID=685728 RepID=UPI00223D2926|nr:phosphorylated adapter RNA export protein [Pristis pectinata]